MAQTTPDMSDVIFQRALCKLLVEIFDGPPGNEAYLLNPGDPGLLAPARIDRCTRRLDANDAGKDDDRRRTSITFTTDSRC